MEPSSTHTPSQSRQRQRSLMLDIDRVSAMSAGDRARTVAQLAHLLLQAAGVAVGEPDDDER